MVGLWSFWRAQRVQWRDPANLRAWQGQRLGALVRHAYATVPFYRRLYDRERVDPAAIRSLGDLARLPVITKAQLQAENEDDLLSRSRTKAALVTAMTRAARAGCRSAPTATLPWSAGAPAISYGRWRRRATGWATIS